jgi:hypothetical protein
MAQAAAHKKARKALMLAEARLALLTDERDAQEEVLHVSQQIEEDAEDRLDMNELSVENHQKLAEKCSQLAQDLIQSLDLDIVACRDSELQTLHVFETAGFMTEKNSSSSAWKILLDIYEPLLARDRRCVLLSQKARGAAEPAFQQMLAKERGFAESAEAFRAEGVLLLQEVRLAIQNSNRALQLFEEIRQDLLQATADLMNLRLEQNDEHEKLSQQDELFPSKRARY